MRNFRRLVLGLLLVSLAGASFAAMDHKPVSKHSNLLVLECLGLTSNAILDEPRVWLAFAKEINTAHLLVRSDLRWSFRHTLQVSPEEYRVEHFNENVNTIISNLGGNPLVSINRQTGKATINSHAYECQASSLQQIDDWVEENVAKPKF